MFKPLDKRTDTYPNKYYEKIIVSIGQRILTGVLKKGDCLPSERELAEQFNVSRVPVREALKILEFMGVVVNISGEGMYIKNVEISSLLDKINFALEIPISTIRELFEVRICIEGMAANLAAQRRTDEDIAEMQKAIKDMERQIIADQDLIEGSTEFHTAVIRASHNQVMESVYQYLGNLLNASKKMTLNEREHAKVSQKFHKEILELIIAGDSNAAGSLMSSHLIQAREKIIE